MNPVPVSATPFELEIVIVIVDVPPLAIDAGMNDFVTVGAARALTVSDAFAGPVFGPLSEVATAPAPMLLL